MIKSYANLLLDIIFPPRCISCNEMIANHNSLCNKCWDKINFISEPFCDICGVPFDYQIEQGAICGMCAANVPSYDRSKSVFVYDDNSSKLITNFKYYDNLLAVKAFGAWINRIGNEFLQDADIIAPVPLHRLKLFLRKYNQSALIVNAIEPVGNVKIIQNLLVRHKFTKVQAGLSKKSRITNVKNAFSINKKYSNLIKDKKVILVDDVITTGSTVEYCAKVLKRGGASKVYILSLARTIL